MKKKKLKEQRLSLNKETIRMLNDPALAEVYGGLWTCGCSDACSQVNCSPYTTNCSDLPVCKQVHVFR